MSGHGENDERYPRDAEHRYRLYVLCDCHACGGTGKDDTLAHREGPAPRCLLCRGEGKVRDVVAAAEDPEGLGLALVTLGREGELEDCAVGVLDVLGEPGQKWILKPWLPSPRNVSDAGRTLATARRKD